MGNENSKTADAPSMEELVGRLRKIQFGLKQNLADLHEKLELLDSKPELLFSLENAKKDAEVRAKSLESEVKKLREEVKAIKELLGLNFQNTRSADS